MSKLRAYFVNSKWEAEGQAIIANTAKEARSYFDYSDWGIEFIDIRSRWIKDANVDGLEKRVVTDDLDGLRRKMYAWLDEGKCDLCDYVGYVEEYKGKAVCVKCLEASE